MLDLYYCPFLENIYINRYRPCIDTSEPFNVTFGALYDSCCVVGEYKDEGDVMQRFSGCETKYRCQLPHLCRRCCDDQRSFLQGPRETCNLGEPASFTHQCYRCEDCLLVSDAVMTNQTTCMAAPGERRACFTYRKEGMVFRGCYYQEAFQLNNRLEMCQKDPANCQICEGRLCNGQELISYCYQCTAINHKCRYDQHLEGHLQSCPALHIEQGRIPKPRCYSVVKWGENKTWTTAIENK